MQVLLKKIWKNDGGTENVEMSPSEYRKLACFMVKNKQTDMTLSADPELQEQNNRIEYNQLNSIPSSVLRNPVHFS